ncbi:hypothetical protein V1525DRAFT_454407 [Lipomyces kononenkoae]|uniref:Uncharacterized protein n=1 Tax=Lipomyces kononenkoae TaxID=34357 RepID=A0ACC3T7S2_LIPKO
MNWTGGKLTCTATKFGISRDKARDFNGLNSSEGVNNERASAMARCKRQQRQHFQKMARVKKSHKREPLSTSGGSGSSSPLVRKHRQKSPVAVEYSINQRGNDEKNDSAVTKEFVQVASMEGVRTIDVEGEAQELTRLESSRITSAEDSDTSKESLAERKRALLDQDDWGAIFLTDPVLDHFLTAFTRSCMPFQEWPNASQQNRTLDADTKIILTPRETPSPSKPQMSGTVFKQRRQSPSTPFHMDYKARGIISTPSSPHSALASSPTRSRGRGTRSAAQLQTVTEYDDDERGYAMQFGERLCDQDLQEYTGDHKGAYGDGKYAGCDDGILSSIVKPEISLGEFDSLQSSFSYSHNVELQDASFESLHTSGSLDHFSEDQDGWKSAMASASIADTMSNSITNHEGRINISEEIGREWRELIGTHGSM